MINNRDVAQILTMELCIEALEEGLKEYYRAEAACRPRIDVWAPCDIPDAYFQWGSMEGTSKRWQVFALRTKSDIAHFIKSAEDVWTHEYYCQVPGKYCGLIFLFSLKNGEPLAIINDGIIQHMRVGARAGLAARYLALPNSEVVGIIGSGGMARSHAMALKQVRNINQIQVYSPTKANRETFAKEMSKHLHIEVLPKNRPEDAVRGAHIVSCCTDSIVPVLKGEWLEEGVFLTTVKGEMEIDDQALNRIDAAVASSPEPLRKSPVRELNSGPESHSLGFKAYIVGGPEERAKIPTPRKINPLTDVRWISFKELLLGGDNKIPRFSKGEIVALGVGGEGGGTQGIAFASVGGLTYRLAREKGVGQELPTEWFLQDIRN